MRNITKLVAFFTIFLLVAHLPPSHSAEQLSITRHILNLLFPVVTLELQNNATRDVYIKCGDFGKGNNNDQDRVMKLKDGDSVSWSFTEILFPLKWCYVRVDEDHQGVFWAADVRLQCTYCKWFINPDGVFIYSPKLQDWEKHHLYSGPLDVIYV